LKINKKQITMSRKETNTARQKRVAYINNLIADGDQRSFNAIDASIELVNWTENPRPMPMGYSRISNNRKRTSGRKLQVIDLKTGGTKQIRTNK